MQIEMLEKLINEALKERGKKEVSFKYELNLGDYPIRVTLGVN